VTLFTRKVLFPKLLTLRKGVIIETYANGLAAGVIWLTAEASNRQIARLMVHV
jgi:hypothetical protein